MSLPSNPVDRLVQKVKNNLGRISDSVVSDMTYDWINKTQQQICNRNNFWFMHATATHTWTQGLLINNLPSDFKDEDSVWILDSGTNAFIELENMDLEDYRRRYDDMTQSQPESYLIQDTTYLLRWVPDKTYTILFIYFKYLADMTQGGSASLLLTDYEDILEAGATYRGFQYLQQSEDRNTWKSVYDELYRDLTAENAERELAGEMVLKPRTDVKGSTVGILKSRSV